MQIIYDGRKVQVWEFVSQGLNIGKWSIGKHCDGVAVVKNVKTIMCQEGGTLPLMEKHYVCTIRIAMVCRDAGTGSVRETCPHNFEAVGAPPPNFGL